MDSIIDILFDKMCGMDGLKRNICDSDVSPGKMHFSNKNVSNSIKISLKFVPVGPINNIPALFQIMAWSRPGDKPLSEPMVASLQNTYIV